MNGTYDSFMAAAQQKQWGQLLQQQGQGQQLQQQGGVRDSLPVVRSSMMTLDFNPMEEPSWGGGGLGALGPNGMMQVGEGRRDRNILSGGAVCGVSLPYAPSLGAQ